MQRSPAPDRARLAGAGFTITFAAAVVAMLGLAVPRSDAACDMPFDGPADALSLAYVGMLLRATPEDRPLNLLFARQLKSIGRFAEAVAPATFAESDPSLAAQARWLVYECHLEQARAEPLSDPSRAAAFETVREDLKALRAFSFPGPRLETLGTCAAAQNLPDLAADYFERAAIAFGGAGASWARAADYRLASGDPGRAEALYEQAADTERDERAARGYASLALACLEQSGKVGGRTPVATKFAIRYSGDLDILSRAARLATGDGESVVARDLGRKAVALGPESDALTQEQIVRELSAGSTGDARRLARSLVQRNPNRSEFRELEAHVAEWGGDDATALEDWLWLFRQSQQDERAPTSQGR